MLRANAILDFWFGRANPTNPANHTVDCQFRKVWFRKDPAFDAQIRAQFLADYEAAAAGRYGRWREHPHSCLALVLLLDQFPRNLFRGQPQSFATDPQALEAAQFAIASNYESVLLPVERVFLYMPFEHSENPSHQHDSVIKFQALVDEAPSLQHCLDYARRHRSVIERFGRFPHRNEILNRPSTQAELAFLKQPGSRF